MAALWLTSSDGSTLMLGHQFAFLTDRYLVCVCSSSLLSLCFVPEGEARSGCCIKSNRLQEKWSSIHTAHHVFLKCFLTLLSLRLFCGGFLLRLWLLFFFLSKERIKAWLGFVVLLFSITQNLCTSFLKKPVNDSIPPRFKFYGVGINNSTYIVSHFVRLMQNNVFLLAAATVQPENERKLFHCATLAGPT